MYAWNATVKLVPAGPQSYTAAPGSRPSPPSAPAPSAALSAADGCGHLPSLSVPSTWMPCRRMLAREKAASAKGRGSSAPGVVTAVARLEICTTRSNHEGFADRYRVSDPVAVSTWISGSNSPPVAATTCPASALESLSAASDSDAFESLPPALRLPARTKDHGPTTWYHTRSCCELVSPPRSTRTTAGSRANVDAVTARYDPPQAFTMARTASVTSTRFDALFRMPYVAWCTKMRGCPTRAARTSPRGSTSASVSSCAVAAPAPAPPPAPPAVAASGTGSDGWDVGMDARLGMWPPCAATISSTRLCR